MHLVTTAQTIYDDRFWRAKYERDYGPVEGSPIHCSSRVKLDGIPSSMYTSYDGASLACMDSGVVYCINGLHALRLEK